MIKPVRILISNDDGIHATGLKVLEDIAAQLSDDIWVVAPEGEQSGASHSLTLTRPLRIRKHGEKRYSVSGTPTDCVMMAVNHLMKDSLPTLILSGVNRGANLAEDITYSGTCSVAMEGTLVGIPSIALSQRLSPESKSRFEPSEKYGLQVIKTLLAQTWQDGVFYNVNFPPCDGSDVRGIRMVAQGHRKFSGIKILEHKDPRGFPYYWLGLGRDDGEVELQTDLGAINSNYIAITPVHLELTQQQVLDDQKTAVDTDF